MKINPSTQLMSQMPEQPAEEVVGLRGERQPTLVSSTIVETDFAELADGSLVEIIEDPENSSRTLLAAYKDGEVRFTHRFLHGNRTLVPIPRDRHVVRHVRLPRGVKPYESVRSLLRQIDSILSRCLDIEEGDRFLLACFVLSTWFIEKLPVAPYVALVGLPRSGKSTALSVLNLMCRRGLLTADITSAAFYRVCDRLTPTLLIDETSTAGESRTLFHLLRTGTTRDSVAIRRDESYKTFGPKVISWTELPDDAALNSRCIFIPLRETRRTDLTRTTNPEILHAAEDLQRQFLQFRFEKLNALKLPKIPGDEVLHSRTRDLYEALLLPVGECAMECIHLVKLFQTQQKFNREPLSPCQAAVLQTLFMGIHQSSGKGTMAVSELTSAVNSLLRATDEGFRATPRRVGAVLTSLGLTDRQRTNTGWYLVLDRKAQKHIHELILAYGVDNKIGQAAAESRQRRDFCMGIKEPQVKIEHFVADNGLSTYTFG
jgi:hypothetical protein